MKYKDKDGRIFDLEDAFRVFCDGRSCLSCQMADGEICGAAINCYSKMKINPREAARLMGYEVIEDGEDINVPAKQTEDKPITRESILEAARKCVCGERGQDYGSPEDNFAIIRELWTTYMNGRAMKLAKEGKPLSLSNADIAAMMALLKIARIATGHAKADNWVDGCGYLACGGEIEGREE